MHACITRTHTRTQHACTHIATCMHAHMHMAWTWTWTWTCHTHGRGVARGALAHLVVRLGAHPLDPVPARPDHVEDGALLGQRPRELELLRVGCHGLRRARHGQHGQGALGAGRLSLEQRTEEGVELGAPRIVDGGSDAPNEREDEQALQPYVREAATICIGEGKQALHGHHPCTQKRPRPHTQIASGHACSSSPPFLASGGGLG